MTMPPENVQKAFNEFSNEAVTALIAIRTLIFEVAREQGLQIEETLKWGQISYLTKTGSTLRIDWSAKTPDQYRLYFNCKTRLVETFKEIHGDLFNYETNRVIVFDIAEKLPKAELKQIIRLTLKYHQLKQLVLLGE